MKAILLGDSTGKALATPARKPGFYPWKLHEGRKRKPTPKSCSLTTTYAQRHRSTCTHAILTHNDNKLQKCTVLLYNILKN